MDGEAVDIQAVVNKIQNQMAGLMKALGTSEVPANVHGTSALPDDVREAHALNTLQGGPSAILGLHLGGLSAHLTRLNIMAEKQLALSSIEMGSGVSTAEESRSKQKILTGSDVADQLNKLSAGIAELQQWIKAAGTTPPVTVSSPEKE